MNHSDADSPARRAWQPGERMAMTGMVLFGVPSMTVFGVVLGWLLWGMFDASFLPESGTPPEISAPFPPAVLVGLMGVTLFEHIGLGMILWALFVVKLRARWFYFAMQVASVLMLASAGGIILAWVISRYLHSIRKEFWEFPPLAAPATGPVPTRSAVPPALSGAIPVVPAQEALVAENERLKRIVAAQALEIQALKEGDTVQL